MLSNTASEERRVFCNENTEDLPLVTKQVESGSVFDCFQFVLVPKIMRSATRGYLILSPQGVTGGRLIDSHLIYRENSHDEITASHTFVCPHI